MATCQLIKRLRWTASACRGLSTGVTPLEGCSVPISDDCFESLPSSLLSKVRERLGVRTPTEIQRKAMPHVLSGRDVVLNAETGSGKTLCFILPILNLMYKYQLQKVHIPTPVAAVLVPTPELAQQVDCVYKVLAKREWSSSVVFTGRRLALKKDTHVVIGTPGGLRHYHLPRLFKHLEILVLDEADILLSGGEQRVAWQCMDVFQSLRKEKQGRHLQQGRQKEQGEDRFKAGDYPGEADQQEKEEEEEEVAGRDSPSSTFPHQLILAAATLPSGGKRTIHSILRARLPRKTLFISTDHTHKATESTDFEFVPVVDEGDKSAKLIEHLQSTLGWNEKSSAAVKLQLGGSERIANADSPLKILVFAATTRNVDAAYATLLSSSPNHAWWRSRVTKLHSEVPFSEREKAMEEFRSGSVQVLFATDLVSRGLDIPDVSAVVHYDFPQNAAVFLHRSGRTGRAGKDGKVLAFYLETDKDLMEVIREATGKKEMTFSKLFSRNKMLRRKLNRRARKQTSN